MTQMMDDTDSSVDDGLWVMQTMTWTTGNVDNVQQVMWTTCNMDGDMDNGQCRGQ